MLDQTFELLITNQRALYEETGRLGARPTANLIGFQAGQPRVSVSCAPSSQRDMVERFSAAGMLLSSLEVDEACLIMGDEWAELVLHQDDLPLPADGYAAAVVAGRCPRGVVHAYQYDRAAGRIHWAARVELRRSLTESLWAVVLAPQCLAGGALTGNVADVVAINQRFGNEVLVFERSPG